MSKIHSNQDNNTSASSIDTPPHVEEGRKKQWILNLNMSLPITVAISKKSSVSDVSEPE